MLTKKKKKKKKKNIALLRFQVIAVTMAVKPVVYNLMKRLYSVLYFYHLPYYLEYSTLF
jgi:hypothetical protein